MGCLGWKWNFFPQVFSLKWKNYLLPLSKSPTFPVKEGFENLAFYIIGRQPSTCLLMGEHHQTSASFLMSRNRKKLFSKRSQHKKETFGNNNIYYQTSEIHFKAVLFIETFCPWSFVGSLLNSNVFLGEPVHKVKCDPHSSFMIETISRNVFSLRKS